MRLRALFLLLAVCHIARLDGTRAATLSSISQIRDFLYQEMKFTGGWYKLLNTTSEIGTEAPVWGQQVTAVLMNASHVQWPLNDKRILVCNVSVLEPVLLQLLADPTSRGNVVGIVVDPQGQLPASFSTSDPFPSSWNAPYANTAYNWNPYGTGLGRRHFTFPVVMLTVNMGREVSWRANYNNRQGFKGAQYWGTMTMDMSASNNSTFCLALRNCKPLGGLSIWAAVPPMAPLYPDLPQSEMPTGNGSLVAPSTMPITLVIAQVDSDSLFHDYTQGSDAPLSGLIAMMGAMELLRVTNASATYTRQIVFLALAGEPWDYMGSRRLMWEINNNATSVSGLDLSRVDQVIEIGMVGRAYNGTSNSTTLYMHSQRPGGGFGNATALQQALTQGAAQTREQQVVLSPASSLNPGIPPSSLMTFLRHKPSIQGVVLTDFDQQYTNPYYHSDLDTGDFVSSEAMTAAALTLARTLHTLASPGGVPTVPLSANLSQLNDLTLRLAFCLMIDGQAPLYGLWCSYVQSYLPQGVSFSNRNAMGEFMPFPWRYVGLILSDTPDATNVTNIAGGRDIFKFLFQWMANTTASNHTSIPCDPYVNFCPAGMACLGWRSGQNISLNNATMGRCKVTTTHIVQATSNRVLFANQLTQPVFFILNDTDPALTAFNQRYGYPADPLWAESDWTIDSPSVKVYMQEPYSTQVAILVSGLILTVATGLAAWFAQKAFEYRVKGE